MTEPIEDRFLSCFVGRSMIEKQKMGNRPAAAARTRER